MLDAIDLLHARIRACRLCSHEGYPTAGPPILSGPSSARLMVVGQAPGRVEAEDTGLPFSGPAGRRLFRWLVKAGWSEEIFRHTQVMTAITKCYPGPQPNGRGDRVPSKKEQDLCRSWLEQELALVAPRVVVPVGGLAIRRFLTGTLKLNSVVGQLYCRPQDDRALSPWARRHLPATVHLVPLPHPSGASLWLNQPEHQVLVEQALAHLARLAEGE